MCTAHVYTLPKGSGCGGERWEAMFKRKLDDISDLKLHRYNVTNLSRVTPDLHQGKVEENQAYRAQI